MRQPTRRDVMKLGAGAVAALGRLIGTGLSDRISFQQADYLTYAATPYDVPDVYFSHEGERCSFDAFLKHYRLTDPARMNSKVA